MGKPLGGLYVVIDPNLPEQALLEAVEKTLKGGADILQLWNPWRDRERIGQLGRRIGELARRYGVPLLVDNDLQLAKIIAADGLHLEEYSLSPSAVRKVLGQDAIVGYTCGNDLGKAIRAEREGADYISFCAMFPSPSVEECEIVPLAKVREAKRRIKIPVFASGGITAQNAHLVLEAGADGIAVISAVFKSPDPEKATRELKSITCRASKTIAVRT